MSSTRAVTSTEAQFISLALTVILCPAKVEDGETIIVCPNALAAKNKNKATAGCSLIILFPPLPDLCLPTPSLRSKRRSGLSDKGIRPWQDKMPS
jgi:hypothetical protein